MIRALRSLSGCQRRRVNQSRAGLLPHAKCGSQDRPGLPLTEHTLLTSS